MRSTCVDPSVAAEQSTEDQDLAPHEVEDRVRTCSGGSRSSLGRETEALDLEPYARASSADARHEGDAARSITDAAARLSLRCESWLSQLQSPL